MARIRTLKPEFWQDEKMAPLPPIDRLVFLGLISQADDAGRLVDNPRLLNGLIFPLTDDDCRQSLETLARLGRVLRYTSESGQRIIQVARWSDHQRVDKPSKHVLPAPSEKALQDNGSRECRESVANVSRDAIAPTLDLGPTTNDLGPTDGADKPPPKPKPAARWRFVPDDWRPTERHASLAAELGEDLAEQEALFRDHEFDKTKSDADRAFSRWLRTAKQMRLRNGRNGKPSADERVADHYRRVQAVDLNDRSIFE
jgi:hypothetical protein